MDYEVEKREIDLMEYWRVIEKRKWVLITFASIVVIFTAISTFTTVPLYKASATLYIEEEVPRVMNVEDEFGNPRQVTDLRVFNTQLEMLKSQNLATRVVEGLNLLSRPELLEGLRPRRNLYSTIKKIVTLRWLFSKKNSNAEENPRRQSLLAGYYAGMIRANLSVAPIRNTRLVEVSYTSRIPRLCAEVANVYAEEFKEFASSLKLDKTEKVSNDLSKQIDNLRIEMEARRKELQKYGEQKGLYIGNPESEEESAAFTKYRSLYDAYNVAVIERNRIAAVRAIVKDSDIDSLPSIDDPRIQQAQREYMNAKDDYAVKSRTLLANHPSLVEAKGRVDRAKENLEQAISSIDADYEKALTYERSLRRDIDNQETEVANLQSDIVLYQTINYEVQSLTSRLRSLQDIQTQVNVSKQMESLKASNISLIDPAGIPGSPFSPNKKRNLILALLFGLSVGVGLCFLLEYLDNTVKGPEEVEKLTGLPSLGVIQYMEQEDSHEQRRQYSSYSSDGQKEVFSPEETKPRTMDIELINHFQPRLPIADDYRTVRTSILLSHAESPPKIIAFTSSLPVEGKSSTLVNLAVAFAQLDKKVLVIDSDIRKPRLHRIFKTGNLGGLSGYLTGKVELKDAIQKTSIKNIWILSSGPVPPNPSELLNSAKMKEMVEGVKKAFDIILLDTPPVLATIDAVIISTLVDSTVLVLRAGEITKKPFTAAVEELRRANAKIIGVVFNGLKASQGKYFYRGYYPYYRYGYYGSEELKFHQDKKY